jgi:hypothetical protein
MQAKHVFPLVLGVVLLSLSATSAFADPLFLGGAVLIGDRYAVTTLHGYARAWIDGHWVTGPADLELQVQVTFLGLHNVVFRVVSGTFQVRYKPYLIDVGHWRGDYNRDTHTSVYQGPATAPDGRQGYFVLYGQDASETSAGVYMHIVSDFRGEYGALWHVDLVALRYKLS